MIPYSAVQGYSSALDQLSVAALADLRGLLSSLDGESPERIQRVLFEAFPEVFNPYAAATSAVSASFYEEVRALAGVSGSFTASSLSTVEAPRWNSLVGWGARGSLFERGGQALVFSLLSGGLTQILTEMAADTTIGNAALDTATMGYQRVPSPGCCAFCGLLASRGADYGSAEAAGTVVGRGMPVSRNYNGDGKRVRGGQAKGIRPRGSRQLGERFHDFCRCSIVPVNEGNYVQMQDDADAYYNAYAGARDKVSGFREAGGYKGYGDQKQSMKMILAEMRQSLGTK